MLATGRFLASPPIFRFFVHVLTYSVFHLLGYGIRWYDYLFVGVQIPRFHVFSLQEQVRIAMTAVTRFILWRLPLDIVWCGQLPCGEFVKIGQAVFNVKFESSLVHRDMADCDKLFRPVFCLQGVEADLEVHE